MGSVLMIAMALGLAIMALFYQKAFAKMKRKEAENLLKASLESEKKERQRIAKDLHDGVQSDLSAIRNLLVTLLKKNSPIYIILKMNVFS
jgi:signal transduction histidine kinase